MVIDRWWQHRGNDPVARAVHALKKASTAAVRACLRGGVCARARVPVLCRAVVSCYSLEWYRGRRVLVSRVVILWSVHDAIGGGESAANRLTKGSDVTSVFPRRYPGTTIRVSVRPWRSSAGLQILLLS